MTRPTSTRDIGVLRLAADGLTATEIGQRLHITADTVKGQLTAWRQRLGARNTAHAVALAYSSGLFNGNPPVQPVGTCQECPQAKAVLRTHLPYRRHMTPQQPAARLYDRLAAVYGITLRESA